nr:uncharacterized mitochondrial protein AtMg00810-like [Tanacetum cinerariifolium]
MLWHMRLGHLNFKTINWLVRHNLVKGLPSKCFENDHTCTACLKGKQHKASCKSKLVNSVNKSIHTLHMDLSGPTSVSSISHKWYCLVVTDDFFRFTWTFFLKTKDETSGILRKFITKIENLKDLKVKIIRTLIEVARTMLADTKLPVTFWAEAVNTACYVQNKDAASQEVKKYVSSLRYIALPNWVHDALLESSLSKPQDDCSTDAPESSGNSNSTTTSTNPPADQLETLTVETPIPTVSSPVPTACFTDSQDPSIDTRLISKRVANQVKTPSLDNILTLTNRFEDNLRVTTNSDESNGVEADVSNMETTITASPTPTLRIHNDHTKSQIIGPVDTPIQTRNKSKEMDVKSAFLYGTIDEEVYVMQPPGFQDPKFPARLSREFEALMHEKFLMSAMGELNFFLGLQVLQKEDGIFLSQDKYVRDILKKFRYSDVRSSNTPMDKENPWGKDETGKDVELHLPDIMFAVWACARHQVTPKECHLHAVKKIFRYLKGHPKMELWYPKESSFDLVTYSDSDYGGATQYRKSTTGWCQFLGRRLISWQCKKQTIVATSTTEAEYVAAASCCRQVLWI